MSAEHRFIELYLKLYTKFLQKEKLGWTSTKIWFHPQNLFLKME